MNDEKQKRVKFAVRSGDPVIILAQGSDQKQYEIRLQVAVFDVLEHETKDPSGMPVFTVVTGGAMQIRTKDDGLQ